MWERATPTRNTQIRPQRAGAVVGWSHARAPCKAQMPSPMPSRVPVAAVAESGAELASQDLTSVPATSADPAEEGGSAEAHREEEEGEGAEVAVVPEASPKAVEAVEAEA